MRAVVLAEFGSDPVEAEVLVDDVRADEVLVRVTDVGICHSDRTVQLGGQDRPLPLILGHEAAGVVERVGRGITSLEPGDHVVASASASCGRCHRCVQGRPQHCTDKGSARADGTARLHMDGRPVHAFVGLGGFATHMLVSERALVRIPRSMPLDKAALLGCAVLTGVGAVRNRARVRIGQTVAVLGCGGVGLNVIQGARLAGASRIVAIDLNRAKFDLARRFGATDVVDASGTDCVDAVLTLVPGGVDHAFEVVGLGRAVEQAIAMTAVRGTTTIVGVAGPGETLTLSPVALMADEKRVQGSRLGSGSFRVDVPLYCEMYLRGRLELDDLVSDVVGLSGVARGLRDLAGSDGARCVVRPG